MSSNTFRLFAMPSFLSGAARTMDIAGNFDDYVTSESGQQADLEAMRSDVLAIAADLRAAMHETLAGLESREVELVS